MRRAVFAIPGDLDTVTGGYLYEKRLLEGLRAVGTDTAHLRLGGSFPDPSPADLAHVAHALEAIDPRTPIILDGFVFGSMDTGVLAGLRAPFVGMVHHPLAHEEGLSAERRDQLFRTERRNVALAAAILVPSPHTARMLVEEYDADPTRVIVARPGTDRAVGRRAPVQPPLILSVGIQHPRKGHDVLLRALARVTDLPWTAVIVGAEWDAAHAADLRALRDALDLGDRVRLAGLVAAEDRDALYRSASMFALATRYEGYGLVFDEALSWGLPVVSCRTGAVPDTVPVDAGILIPPEDPVAFADALRSVLADPQRRDSLAAAASAAGARLPSWLDTARTAQAVLDGLT